MLLLGDVPGSSMVLALVLGDFPIHFSNSYDNGRSVCGWNAGCNGGWMHVCLILNLEAVESSFEMNLSVS